MTDVSGKDAARDDGQLDLAVIYVHGIGAQARGATLLTWVEPLVDLLDRVAETRGLVLRIAAARGLAGDDPEVEIQVGHAGAERHASWLMLEARWAESFHPSSAAEVLKWAFGFGYRAISRALDMLFRQVLFAFRWRVWRRARDEYGLDWRHPGRLAFLLFLFVPVGGGFIAYMILLPFLVAGFLLVLAVTVLPVLVAVLVPILLVAQRVPLLGKRVRPLVAGLVTSIGDAQAYRSRAIQAAAMRDVLLDRLKQGRARASKVVVVAHSQGAAISVRTLLEEENPVSWPDLLVTVGAGTTLLNQRTSVDRWARWGTGEWVNIWTQLDPVPAGPVGQRRADVRARLVETVWHHTSGGFEYRTPEGETWLRWRAEASDGGWSGHPEAAALAFAESDGRETPYGARRIANKVLGSSSDRFIFHDLPTRLPSLLAHGPEEWPVANRLSLTRDHVTYAQNLTQVQYGLARRLLSISGDVLLPELPARTAEWHTRRVRALFMARFMAMSSALAIVVVLADADRLGRILSRAVERLEQNWNDGGWAIRAIPEQAVPFLTIGFSAVAVATALTAAVSAVWTPWHRNESRRTCADPDGRGLRLGIGGSLFVGLHVSLTFFSAIWWLSLVDFWGSVDYPMTHTLTETLVHHASGFGLLGLFLYALVWPFIGLRPHALRARRAAAEVPPP